MQQNTTINPGDYFLHTPSNKIFECLGTDDRLIWYDDGEGYYQKSFDPQDCDKLSSAIGVPYCYVCDPNAAAITMYPPYEGDYYCTKCEKIIPNSKP